MSKRMGNYRGRKLGLVAAIAAIACLGVASVAVANNLDRRTATNYAKSIARDECRSTTGCKQYFVRGLHRVSRHKAVGKIAVAGERPGFSFVCTRQLVIKLDHYTGDLDYGVSRRNCRTFN